MKCQWYELTQVWPIFTDADNCTVEHAIFIWVMPDIAIPLCPNHGDRVAALLENPLTCPPDAIITATADPDYINVIELHENAYRIDN